jgi:hypothetical protein
MLFSPAEGERKQHHSVVRKSINGLDPRLSKVFKRKRRQKTPDKRVFLQVVEEPSQ